MRFREQPNERQSQQPATPEGGENLDALRAAGVEAGRATDAATERALSGNSLHYNEASQQTGGE